MLTHRAALLVTVPPLIVALPGCSSSSVRSASSASSPAVSSTPDAPADPSSTTTATADASRTGPFCTTLIALNAKGKAAKSPQAGLQVLASSLPHLKEQQESVPDSARSDYDIVMAAAQTAVTTKNVALLDADPIVQADSRLVAACA